MKKDKRETIKKFIIACHVEAIEYEIKVADAEEARQWVINHLDLSKEWTIYPKI